MDDPETDDTLSEFLRNAEKARQEAHRVLIALARLSEVYEAWEEQRTSSNPWIFGQVVEN
jgi:hypothetical protein